MTTYANDFERSTVVGVFENGDAARRAVEELHRAGFSDRQIGVVSHEMHDRARDKVIQDEGSYAGEGAAAGALVGGGVGAAWAIGIAAGLLPAIGPVIAGGTLAAVLASAGAGAAAGGLGGALIGAGLPEDEANYYESEFSAGRTLVSVRAGARYDEIAAILRRHGAHVQERTGSFTRASFAPVQSDPTIHPSMTQSTACDRSMSAHESQAGCCSSEHQTMHIPVRRDEVIHDAELVEPRPTASPSSAPIHASDELRVPVHEDEVRHGSQVARK